jgi:uncharacterized membrane protein
MIDTFLVLANQYDSEDDALADYEAIRSLYGELGLIDTYDAAVIARKENGKVRIVKRVEEPTRHGSVIGLKTGLATGAVIALFPAAGIGLLAGALGGATLGAGLGAVAGHVAGGLKRGELKELGETLDKGSSGLIVVAATDVEEKVSSAIKHAKKRAKARLQTDVEELKKEIDSLAA